MQFHLEHRYELPQEVFCTGVSRCGRGCDALQRLGTANDIAHVIVFLCSDGARFIQGQVIEVNGRFLMV
jgi:NAD(P)-dependent dehydrogenase (short-subunit alcohol dehydrogenase family)